MIILDLDKEYNNISHYENLSSMQRRLITEITKFRNELLLNNINATHIIVGNRILNFISDSSLFRPVPIDIDSVESFYKIGNLMQLDVYVDLNLPDDELIITIDKNLIRDIKLDAILFDSDLITSYSKHIKVKSIVI